MLQIEKRDSERVVYHEPSITHWLNQRYEHDTTYPASPIERLQFRIESQGLTVYNPAPVIIEGVLHLWGRTEPAGIQETGGSVVLYTKSLDGLWDAVPEAPVFEGLQDPFDCGIIDGYHVIGGNKVYEVPGDPNLGYCTALYRYRNTLTELIGADGHIVEPFVLGPPKMKGIRVVELGPGRKGVFTRPQKPGFGDRGQIGYFEISSLDDLQASLTEYDQRNDQTSLLAGLFISGEWGGINQAIALDNGHIFALGHIAGFYPQEERKQYYPMSFTFHPQDRSVHDFTLLATDREYPQDITPKKADLGTIYYPGGIVLIEGVPVVFYGLGDSTTGSKNYRLMGSFPSYA